MEDLAPLIFFLVIVVVNVLKFIIEKGGKAKKNPVQSGETPPKRTSAFESFFTDLAEQMAPKPTELADWPEGVERPDYTQTMDEFQPELAEEPEARIPAEIIPFQVPRSQAAKIQHSGGARLQLDGGKNLRQAMLAHIVFSPPRALDLSFSDTCAKHN